MPVDELGLALLRDYADSQGWNVHNVIISAGQSAELRGAPTNALAEGFAWLDAQGLLAPTPGQTALGARFITRLGHQALEHGLAPLRASSRIQTDLHRTLERKVRRQFLLGEYELAAFAAMREVEIRVREAVGADESELGVKLMRRVFGPDGPLHIEGEDGGETVARMELYAGALGLFKNPTSHREVAFDDPTEASEVIMLADLLMRMLDRLAPTNQNE